MFWNDISKNFIKRRVPKEYKLKIKRKVTSTNLILKEKAKTGEEEYSVLIASEQTNGRGRLGRTFYSPSASGIYMSILLAPQKGSNPLLITVDAAVCVARTLESVTGEKASIKWVNDIYIKGKKVCGILAEAADDKIILGIGINVTPPKNGFPEDIKDRAGALFEIRVKKIKEQIISMLLCEFYDIYNNPDRKKLSAEYKARSMIIGKEILILQNGQKIPATAIDINDDYSLLVEKKDKTIESLSTGDVSIKI